MLKIISLSVAGPTVAQLEVFFVSSWCVNLIRVFLRDDTLH